MQPLATENCLINGSRVAFGVFGQGWPVVLIHGTPSSSLIWRNVVPNLVNAGYKVHLFDLLGYGLSERPWNPSTDTSISGQVPILEGLLSEWALNEAHIVAHDIGGAVAQRFTVQAPQRVKTLTLIDTVSFDSYPSKRTRQQMQAGLENLIKKPDHEHCAHFREWLLSAVCDKEKFAGSSLDTFVDYISGPVGQGSLFQHQIRHYDPRHTMEIIDHLSDLGQLPVHIIWGAQDEWQIIDWAHKLNQAIPGSELDIVDGGGHFCLEDKPQEISRLILDFLGR